MCLFYPEESKTKLIDYADAEYLSDPHKALSQPDALSTCFMEDFYFCIATFVCFIDRQDIIVPPHEYTQRD